MCIEMVPHPAESDSEVRSSLQLQFRRSESPSGQIANWCPGFVSSSRRILVSYPCVVSLLLVLCSLKHTAFLFLFDYQLHSNIDPEQLKKRQAMGNVNSSSDRSQKPFQSDRELARELIENKRQRSVKFAESASVSLIESPDKLRDASALQAKGLRSNLMRVQTDRDPLFYYEVMKVVGVGSMGSVAMVRKRDAVVGGSARRRLVASFKHQKRTTHCFKIPVVGGLFRYCMDAAADDNIRSSHRGDALLVSQHSGVSEVTTESIHGGNKASVLYALKSIHLNRVTDQVFIEELKNEIEILKKLVSSKYFIILTVQYAASEEASTHPTYIVATQDHPHIVRPIETFVHRNQLSIVMELCAGGDLYSRDPYTEDEAARIVSSIISAVSYMHDRKITHRDLKYENILFVSDSPLAEIKLIDFGLSKKYASDKELTEGVGTVSEAFVVSSERHRQKR